MPLKSLLGTRALEGGGGSPVTCPQPVESGEGTDVTSVIISREASHACLAEICSYLLVSTLLPMTQLGCDLTPRPGPGRRGSQLLQALRL